MRPTLDDVEERYRSLQGMTEEALAKARLFKSQAEADPSRIPEIELKFEKLLFQMAKYKQELALIKKDWDDISFEYGSM